MKLAQHILAMQDDAHFLEHPEWPEIVNDAKKALNADEHQFLYKDKSGRGIVNKVDLADLLSLENDEDWNDQPLHEWAADAEPGDRWESTNTEITCIKSRA